MDFLKKSSSMAFLKSSTPKSKPRAPSSRQGNRLELKTKENNIQLIAKPASHSVQYKQSTMDLVDKKLSELGLKQSMFDTINYGKPLASCKAEFTLNKK